MSSANPKALLSQGVEILRPVMEKAGFSFLFESEGKGSGGFYASGSFRRDDRSLELHMRGSLGLVTYHIGDAELRHDDYMHLLGVYGRNAYPGFSEDPMAAFRNLRSDLESFCADFLSGDGTQFLGLAAELRRNPGQFKGLPA